MAPSLVISTFLYNRNIKRGLSARTMWRSFHRSYNNNTIYYYLINLSYRRKRATLIIRVIIINIYTIRSSQLYPAPLFRFTALTHILIRSFVTFRL